MRLILFFWLCLLLPFVSVAQTSATQPDTLETKSGLRYYFVARGKGQKVNYGSKVSVHYTGQLTNGKVFDTSSGGKPIKFRAGKGEVIKGWNEMLQLMRAGDEVMAIIPARLGYGKYGVPESETEDEYRIPPNAELIFRIRVVEAAP